MEKTSNRNSNKTNKRIPRKNDNGGRTMVEKIYTEQLKTDSIEITKNTKGANWSIKAYGDTTQEIQKKLEGLKMVAVSIAKEVTE